MAGPFLIYSASQRLSTIVETATRDGLEVYDVEELGDGTFKAYLQPIGGPQRWRGIVEELLEQEGETND